MAIKIKEVPIKAHNSIGKVEKYYTLLQQAYKIIQNELVDKQVDKKINLQIAVKAINNLARLDRIIPTLLVFGVYPQITKINTLSLFIIKRAEAICAAIKKIHYL